MSAIMKMARKTGEFALQYVYNMPHRPGNCRHVELFIFERVMAAEIIRANTTRERDT